MAIYGNNPIETYTLTIGSAGSFSGSAFLNGNGIIGIGNAGTWTASNLTFQTTLGSSPAPDAGGTWVRISPVGAGSEWTLPAGSLASGTGYYPIPATDLPSLYWVRAVSGGSAGGTLQAQSVALVLFTRPL